MSDTLAIFAASWGVLMAISPVLQIRRIVQRRSSDDVSIGYLGVLLVGFALWVGYGLSLSNLAIIVPNTVALVVGMLTVVIARRYRTSAGSHGQADRDRDAEPEGESQIDRAGRGFGPRR